MNSKVADYFQKQPKDRRKILKQLRDLILDTFPGVKEGFSYGVPIYDGGRFYLANLRNQVNLGFSIIGLNKKEVALFEGSGKTAKHIKINSLIDHDQQKGIVELLKLVKKKAKIPH